MFQSKGETWDSDKSLAGFVFERRWTLVFNIEPRRPGWRKQEHKNRPNFYPTPVYPKQAKSWQFWKPHGHFFDHENYLICCASIFWHFRVFVVFSFFPSSHVLALFVSVVFFLWFFSAWSTPGWRGLESTRYRGRSCIFCAPFTCRASFGDMFFFCGSKMEFFLGVEGGECDRHCTIVARWSGTCFSLF